MSDEMTDHIFNFIRTYIDTHGFPPSQREIATGCFISRPGVIRHLDRLEATGRIVREPNKARGIFIPSQPENAD